MKILTLGDFDLKGKTVLLRVDMNCPIDPTTGEISGVKRIEEATETIRALSEAKVVKLEGARAAGADELVDGNRGELAKQVSALTGGRGVDSVLDVEAAKETLEASSAALAPGGRLVVVGVRPPAVFGDQSKFTVDATQVVGKGIEIHGSRYVTAAEIGQTLELLRQQRVRAIVDSTFPLEEAEHVHQLIRDTGLVGRVALVIP